jgi:hypothetical protein
LILTMLYSYQLLNLSQLVAANLDHWIQQCEHQ